MSADLIPRNNMTVIDTANILNNLFSKYTKKYLRSPVNLFDEEWDNLLILDACRYDLMTEYSGEFSGTIERRWSGGGSSQEFLEYYLSDRTLNDLIWVTANPWVEKYDQSIFKTVHVWDEEWDDALNTVKPKSVVESAKKAIKEYPNKRMIVHFIQPHYPFIGDLGANLPDHRSITGDSRIRSDSDSKPKIWDLLKQGAVSNDQVWNAYRENLEIVIPWAKHLINYLDGVSVITSDHGNAFGERGFPIPVRLYGHSSACRIRPLVEVPWIKFEGDRREVHPEEILSDESSRNSIEDRLHHLGYR